MGLLAALMHAGVLSWQDPSADPTHHGCGHTASHASAVLSGRSETPASAHTDTPTTSAGVCVVAAHDSSHRACHWSHHTAGHAPGGSSTPLQTGLGRRLPLRGVALEVAQEPNSEWILKVKAFYGHKIARNFRCTFSEPDTSVVDSDGVRVKIVTVDSWMERWRLRG